MLSVCVKTCLYYFNSPKLLAIRDRHIIILAHSLSFLRSGMEFALPFCFSKKPSTGKCVVQLAKDCLVQGENLGI